MSPPSWIRATSHWHHASTERAALSGMNARFPRSMEAVEISSWHNVKDINVVIRRHRHTGSVSPQAHLGNLACIRAARCCVHPQRQHHWWLFRSGCGKVTIFSCCSAKTSRGNTADESKDEMEGLGPCRATSTSLQPREKSDGCHHVS